MEALGRGIASLFCAVSLVFLLVYQKTSAVGWQRNQTVRAMSKEYVKSIQRLGMVTEEGWGMFWQELQRLGKFDAKLTIYEKRRYEGEAGAIYLYSEWEQSGTEEQIPEGSYVRLTIVQEDMQVWDRFWYGDGCVVFVGGRII